MHLESVPNGLLLAEQRKQNLAKPPPTGTFSSESKIAVPTGGTQERAGAPAASSC